jgi:hypothetical protein
MLRYFIRYAARDVNKLFKIQNAVHYRELRYKLFKHNRFECKNGPAWQTDQDHGSSPEPNINLDNDANSG